MPKGVIYRFIDHFWVRESSPYSTLDSRVFDAPVASQSIRKRTSEVNAVLDKLLEFPWRLEPDAKEKLVRKRPA